MAGIADIQHRKLALTDNPETEENRNRPELRIWADNVDDMDTAVVVLSIGPMFGETRRFVEMTPDEARRLAADLRYVADGIDELRR